MSERDTGARPQAPRLPWASILGAAAGLGLGLALSGWIEPRLVLWREGLRQPTSRDSHVSMVMIRGLQGERTGLKLDEASAGALSLLASAPPEVVALDVLLSGGICDEDTRARFNAAVEALGTHLISGLTLALGARERRDPDLHQRAADLQALSASLPPAVVTPGALAAQRRALHPGLRLPEPPDDVDGVHGAVLFEAGLSGSLYQRGGGVGYFNLPLPSGAPQHPGESAALLSRFLPERPIADKGRLVVATDLFGGAYRLVPSLALAAAARYLCGPGWQGAGCLSQSDAEHLELNGRSIPLTSDGELIFNYRKRFYPIGTQPCEDQGSTNPGHRELELLFYQHDTAGLVTAAGCAIPLASLRDRLVIIADAQETAAFTLPVFLGSDADSEVLRDDVAFPGTVHGHIAAQLLSGEHLPRQRAGFEVGAAMLLAGLALLLRRHGPSSLNQALERRLPPRLQPLGFFAGRALSQPEPLLLAGLWVAALGAFRIASIPLPLTTPTAALVGSLLGFLIDLPIQLSRAARATQALLGAQEAAETQLRHEHDRLQEELLRAQEGQEAAQARIQGIQEALTLAEAKADEDEIGQLRAQLSEEQGRAAATLQLVTSVERTLADFSEAVRRLGAAEVPGRPPPTGDLDALLRPLREARGQLNQLEPERAVYKEMLESRISAMSRAFDRIGRALAAMAERHAQLEEDLPAPAPPAEIASAAEAIGVDTVNPEMTSLCGRLTGPVANAPFPALILGETGTGKERLARAIHDHGKRRDHPFIARSCATLLDGNLADVTLFGRVKNWPNRGDTPIRGLFEMAHGGTLFLDEIHCLPIPTQQKLLRVIQEGVVEVLGSSGEGLKVDVRVIAAGHPSLHEHVREGRFQLDLYLRLAAVTELIPPLRERGPADIELLAHALCKEAAEELGHPLTLSQGAIRRLQQATWPGNVRELQNAIRQAAMRAPGEILSKGLIDEVMARAPALHPAGRDMTPRSLALSEDHARLLEILRRTGFSYKEAAEHPGSPYTVEQTLGRHARVLQARSLEVCDWRLSKAADQLAGEDAQLQEAAAATLRRLIKALRLSLQRGSLSELRRSLERQYRVDSCFLITLAEAIEEGRVIEDR